MRAAQAYIYAKYSGQRARVRRRADGSVSSIWSWIWGAMVGEGAGIYVLLDMEAAMDKGGWMPAASLTRVRLSLRLPSSLACCRSQSPAGGETTPAHDGVLARLRRCRRKHVWRPGTPKRR